MDHQRNVVFIKRVHPDSRVTSDSMTIGEYSDVVGIRGTSIQAGAPLFIKAQIGMSVEDIAKEEIRQKKCPLKIKRMISIDEEEVWSVNELTVPPNAS